MSIKLSAFAWGLDYARFLVINEAGYQFTCRKLPYLDLVKSWYHGQLFVNLTGGDLEQIRMFSDVESVVLDLAYQFQVTRLDVFIDVNGRHLDELPQPGTVIMNGGCIETIYSQHLKNRGDTNAFSRAYDAMAAGHYEQPMTRFECEFKREMSRAIVDSNGWNVDPIRVAQHYIREHYDVQIVIADRTALDFNAPRRKYSHSRERFYRRYGKGILRDMEELGAQGLHQYIFNIRKDIENESEARNDKSVTLEL